MTTDTVPQTVLFPDLFDKPLVAKFNQEQASSDGGAVLLKAAERVSGLVKAFARCLSDRAGEDSAHACGPDAGGHLRHQTRRPAAPRAPRCQHLADAPPQVQEAGRSAVDPWRASHWPRSRQLRRSRRRGRPARTLNDMTKSFRVGGAMWCVAAPPPVGAGAAHHDRSGPDSTTRRTAPSSTVSLTSMGTMTKYGVTCRYVCRVHAGLTSDVRRTHEQYLTVRR